MVMFIKFGKKLFKNWVLMDIPKYSGSFRSHSIAICVTCRWNFYAFALLIDRIRSNSSRRYTLILFRIAASNGADFFLKVR